ncbi:MAG: MBL fold metallo-hydrolase [Deltaproteobacteria bacterium]|nr:MBL fold metallo-hydrolase [Deltaproteobacteria bacterium]
MTLVSRRSASLRLERTLASPRFRDGAFRNASGATPGLRPGTSGGVLKDFLFGESQCFPPAPLPSVSPLEGWRRTPDAPLRTTWLGHSTVLVELGGIRVLTDPVWANRASPVSFAGPRRFQPVPVALDTLPPLDAVIVSHDHYDHLDRDAVVALARRGTPIYTSLGVGSHLERWGIPEDHIVELDWWESVMLPRAEVRVTATPSQHFSGRSMSDRNRTLWSSFVIESADARVFFSGDTGLTHEYEAIATRFGAFDLVMLEVGAFHPAWGHIHLGPDQALEALALLRSRTLLPVHWGTFNLAIHAWDEPAERLAELSPERDVHLVMPRLGEVVVPARVESLDPWWRALAAPGSRRSIERAELTQEIAEARVEAPLD